jgi:hypothetical protein
MRLVPKRLKWLGLGAGIAWLFDPDMGQTRRTRIADRTSSLLRDAGQNCEGKSRYAADKLQGLSHAIERKHDDASTQQPVHATG